MKTITTQSQIDIADLITIAAANPVEFIGFAVMVLLAALYLVEF